MNIGIIGYGFVGKALADGIIDDVNILKIDPKLNTTTKDLIDFNPGIIFICVPTPMNDDGTQDISILKNVIEESSTYCPNAIIVLKSTVLPSYITSLDNQITSLVVNPEFLRENFASEDFINSDLIIFGSKNLSYSQEVSNFYKKYTKCINKEYVFVDAVTASLIKYTINSFLASKVIFFNEVKKIFDNSATDDSWADFIKALSLDQRIGNSHMEVPGPDGRYGFGGACFPKDTNALYNYSCNIGSEFELLKKVILLNNNIRADYTNPTIREIEQNIGFTKNSKE